jgi:hypothetical protein
VVVLGYIVRCPLGGMAWHYLQYAMGLAALGHDVWFVEDSDDYPSCYDPVRHVTDSDPTYGLEFTRRTFDRVGLGERWAYYDGHTAAWSGPARDEIAGVCASADLVLNVSAANPLRSWLEKTPVRVFVDTDPVFEQIRQLTVPARHARALEHTSFFTFGENIERADTAIPKDGLPWRATRQPIVLDAWPVTPGPRDGKFTTVMQWESYPPREYEGVRYGLKGVSFEPYVDLPEKAGAGLELALGTPSAPRELLTAKGWTLVDPLAVTRDPWTYQHYIRTSKAEFSIAKHGFVVARSGWFSERSAAYLASGRPVLAQETGFSAWLAAGGVGVVPFATPEEALAGIGEIDCRYPAHCRAARDVAAEYFASEKVLTRLIDMASGDAPPLPSASGRP